MVLSLVTHYYKFHDWVIYRRISGQINPTIAHPVLND